MTDELVAWLRVQLDDDERVARDAGGRNWGREAYGCVVDAADNGLVVYSEGTPSREQADHIALHDPARVLREVEAKRRILAEHKYFQVEHEAYGGCKTCSWRDDWEELHGEYPCATIRLLALPIADRPGYQPEWAPQ